MNKQGEHLINNLTDHTFSLWNKMIAEVRDYAFILIDKNGLVINWNSGAETLKQYKKEEVIGKHFRMFYTLDEQEKKVPEQLIKQAMENGKAVHEGWRVRKDGTVFWGSVVMTALHNDKGEVEAFSKVTRDLSERKTAEDALKQKNQELERINQELASFAYIASHDLQEPLRKIQTFSMRIAEMEAGNFSERSLDYFNRMRGASARMQKLIDDLLTYSRMSTAEKKIERVDLNEILAQAKGDLEERINEKNVTIDAASLPVVNGIRFQFHQLLLNLLSNAIKFSKPDVKPEIIIRCEVQAGTAITKITVNPAQNYYHITVSDNGIGFEQEYSEKIFEVFQRLHGKAEYSGTGIGLAICRKIIQNHSGYIFAESQPQKGSVFHIYLSKES